MAYILDSGFVYAQLNGKDDWHQRVSEVTLAAEREAIFLPIPAITEISFLLQRDLGIESVADFVETLADTSVILEVPTPEDYVRSSHILRKYNDANIDFVNACIVAMAERLNITKILTVDRRHFGIFRPKHCDSFEILPETL